MQLSKRLSSVASMVTAGYRLADVGTDHGYVPISLYERGVIPSAIAMDINKGPLERAKLHIAEMGMGQVIETRLSDGLQNLRPGEADSVVIAGMGGPLIVRILSSYPEVTASLKELVLQPQSEIEQVRRWLHEQEYHIVEEHMVFEDGKYYPMFKALKTGSVSAVDELEFKFGNPAVLKEPEVLKAFLERELLAKNEIIEKLLAEETEKSSRRAEELKQLIAQYQEMLARL